MVRLVCERIGGRFQIDNLDRDLIGQGAMGDVYRGVDTQTGQAVAIKVLRPEIVASHPGDVSRFLREGEALRQLNHPNIVKMVAAVEEDGRHYLVMEYAGGGSLRELLKREGRLSIARAVEIALDVADALARAHRLGVVHRDLKPANVLLAEDGTPRLTDFGMAHLTGRPRLTETDVVVGTVEYLGPEIYSGTEQDTRTDIWSLGMVLYEMLTGERPFVGGSLAALVTAILTQPVPDLSQVRPDVPDALADLVYRMLEKDRDARMPSVRLVGAELGAILSALSGQRSVVSYRLPHAMGRSAAPTLPPEARKHNLPLHPTPFVGREAELAELARLLGDPDVRLLTILGAGGMGKTRLALEAATAQIERYAQGVYFVSLAPLQSTEAIVPTVAEAIGFSFYEGGDPEWQLLDYLRQKSMLLVLDNYEHLLDGVEVVADILETAPSVKILSTSRISLNIRGEHRFHVVGMAFPDWETTEDAVEYSAVKLFLQSARRVRPGFELQADDLRYVARICRLVQGMPLGILLAASWVEMLTPTEIAAEIGQSFDFLETNLRDLPERQHSIRAVFDYSWSLLRDQEREVFQALSVFRGGFTREAAQRVTDASLRELMVLVSKSLLHRTPTGRYEVHELLRQYAARKLCQSSTAAAMRDPQIALVRERQCLGVYGRDCVAVDERHCAAVRDRHCAYYIAALQKWERDLKGARQRAAMIEMDVEIENVRAAWTWAIERGHVEQLDQAMESLGLFYDRRFRHQDGEAAFREVAKGLAASEQLPSGDRRPPVSRPAERVLAKSLAWQSVFSQGLGRTELACELLRQSLALLDGPELADGDTRLERAFITWVMGRLETDREVARRLSERSLALYQALGKQWRAATALLDLGGRAYMSGDYGEAVRRFKESVAIYRALGDQTGIAGSTWRLGLLYAYRGQVEQAERLGRESLVRYQELGDRVGVGLGVIAWGMILGLLGKYAEAQSVLEERDLIQADLGLRRRSAYLIHNLGFAKMHLGRYTEARDYARTSRALLQEFGSSPGLAGHSCTLGCVALAEEAYAQARRLLQQYAAVSREHGRKGFLAEALAVSAYAERGLGDRRQAERDLHEALRIAADIQAFIPSITALPAMALLLADRGEVERAVELYASASRYPFVANSRWFEDVAGKHIAAVATNLPSDAVAAAQERGQARGLEATAAELLMELEEWCMQTLSPYLCKTRDRSQICSVCEV